MNKKENKAIYKYIHCDPYKRGVSIFIGDCESLKKWAKKFYNRPDERDLLEQLDVYCNETRYINKDVAASTYGSDICGHQIVHIPSFDFKYDPSQLSNVAHEILHAVFSILDYVGVEYRYNGTNEPYTYLFEYVFKEALIEKGYKRV